MRVPLSWLREYVDVPADATPEDVLAALVSVGFEEEDVHRFELQGPIVVGEVLDFVEEPQSNGKTIRWCQVDVGEYNAGGVLDGGGTPRGVVCGAANFLAGDAVVVALPGAVLPGGFAISARRTYGHVSDGMICSARELGLGDDHDGIIVLPPDAGQPGDDVRPVLGLDEETIELEINPDRAYALSIRGIAREVLVSVEGASGFRDPADRVTPAANDDGHPVVVEDADGCPVFVALTVT